MQCFVLVNCRGTVPYLLISIADRNSSLVHCPKSLHSSALSFLFAATPAPSYFRLTYMRQLRKFLFYFVIGLVVLLNVALILAWVYGPEIKQAVTQRISEQLAVEVQVEEVDFSLLRNFPFASVTFEGAHVRESVPGSMMNVAEAGKFHVLLNLFDLLQDGLTIEQVVLEDATIFLKVDAQGKANYIIWKTGGDSTTASTDSFTVKLNEVRMKNVDLRFLHEPGGQDMHYLIHNATASGAFSEEEFSVALDGKLYTDYYKIDGTAYVRDKETELAGELLVNTANERYDLQGLRLVLGGSAFRINGHFAEEGEELVTDLNIEGEETDIKTLLALVPDEYLEALADYESSGRIYFSGMVRGPLTGEGSVLLAADFGIEQGTIRNRTHGIALQQVNLKGRYTNGQQHNLKTSELELADVSAVLEGRHLAGNFLLRNFDRPYLKTHLKTDLLLQDLHRFLPIKGVKEMQGLVKVDAGWEGELPDESHRMKGPALRGKLELQDVTIIPDSSEFRFTNVGGKFLFGGDDMIVEQLSGNLSESDFALSGYFRNVSHFLFLPNEKLLVEADFSSHLLNLDELLEEEESTGTDTVYSFSFPEYLEANLRLDIDRIIYDRFAAEEVRGNFRYSNNRMAWDGVNLRTMQGRIASSGSLSEENGRFHIETKSQLTDISVRDLFWQFEDFGQEYLQHQHLKGRLTADVDLKSTYRSDLSLVEDELDAVADMVVRDGELIEFEPVTELAGFIKLKKMRHLVFDEMKNQVIITNRLITLPRMLITSNAMSMDVSGTHTFDNVFQYKIGMNLSELLFGTGEVQESKFGEIAPDERGKLNLYITMSGNDDEYNFTYDRKRVQQNIAQGMKEEKKELRQVLQEEFGPRDEEPEQSLLPEEPSRTRQERKKELGNFWKKLKED